MRSKTKFRIYNHIKLKLQIIKQFFTDFTFAFAYLYSNNFSVIILIDINYLKAQSIFLNNSLAVLS